MANNQNISQRNNDDFHFDLMEHIGVLGRRDNGWTKEVNIVAWNGGKAKVDIRDWDPDHTRMTKGITLFEEEAEMLADALARRYGLRYRSATPVKETMREEPVKGVGRPDPSEETGHGELAEESACGSREEEIPFEAAPAAEAVAETSLC